MPLSTSTLREIAHLLRDRKLSIRDIHRLVPGSSRPSIARLRIALAATGLSEQELDDLDDSEWHRKLNWRRPSPDWVHLKTKSADGSFAAVWRAERLKNPQIARYSQSRVQFRRQLEVLGDSSATRRHIPTLVWSNDGRQSWKVQAIFDRSTRTVICHATPSRIGASVRSRESHQAPPRPVLADRTEGDEHLLGRFDSFCAKTRMPRPASTPPKSSSFVDHAFRLADGVRWLAASLSDGLFDGLIPLDSRLKQLGDELSRIWLLCDRRFKRDRFLRRSGKLVSLLDRNK